MQQADANETILRDRERKSRLDPYGQIQQSWDGALDQETTEVNWTIRDAEELYRMDGWGDSFFFINPQGHVAVRAGDESTHSIDLYDLVRHLKQQGIAFPLLIRFQDLLRSRVSRLNRAFGTAIEESGFQSPYTGVYPIKVNQLHEVVEEVLDAGRPFGMGLECGSKAELVAALPHLEDDQTLLICNGYKDADMLRLILAGQSLGRNVIPVVEKYQEFQQLMRLGTDADIRPRFGVRIRLATSGVGKWADSGGDQSKFGISIPELLSVVRHIESAGLTDSLVLLHFHLGSQLGDIQTLKTGVKEIAQVYAQLTKRKIPIRYLDVGGGLGINYDADYAGDEEGINYTLQEYANAVVYTVKEVCDADNIVHPVLISESGRAITAHHSVLIVETLGAYRKDEIDKEFRPGPTDHSVVRELYRILATVNGNGASLRLSELLEAYHDAVEKRKESDSLFSLGYLSIEQKALTEQLYWSACRSIHGAVERLAPEHLPAELVLLDDHLVEQYLCDFSVFQSMLDHWSIGQRFPIVPLNRLDERPRVRGVLVDLTCDSDGKVSRYVSSEDDKDFLPVHELRNGEPYYLGFFLMGAYQDIMGDAHNLFGRVAEVHVYADEDEADGYYIEKIIPGMSVEQMLALVQYFPNDLQRRMNKSIRQKTAQGSIRPKAGVELLEQYTRLFAESTYYKREA